LKGVYKHNCLEGMKKRYEIPVRRTALNQTDNLLEMKQEVTTSQLS
jgi:hypothetical protein